MTKWFGPVAPVNAPVMIYRRSVTIGLESLSRRVVRRLGWVLVLLGAAAGLRLVIWFVSGGPAPALDPWVALFTGLPTLVGLSLLVAGSGFMHWGLRGAGSAATIAAIFGCLALFVGIGLALLVPDRFTIADIPYFGP